MRLKLDENLSKEAAEIFRQAGHNTESVFSFLFPPDRYSGIAVFRLPSRPSYDDLLVLCRTLLVALGEKDINGKLWIIQKNRIREYQPETDIETGNQ